MPATALPGVDISLLITMVKGTIATAQKAREISKGMEHIGLKQIIMDLSNELLDVQVKVIDLREELLALREENRVLKEAETGQKPMMYGSIYQFDGDYKRYCVGCWDKDKKKHTVVPSPMSGVHICSVCRTMVPEFG